MRQFPDDVMQTLKQYTEQVIAEQVAADTDFANVWASYSQFYQSMREYNDLTLKAYYQQR